MNELFVKASRLALRFKSSVGSITTEDLWNLPLTSLDFIAKSLNKEIKLAEEESFIKTRTKINDILETAFEVVKYVITVKLAEAEVKKTAALRKEQASKIDEIIARKQDESLSNKSIEELQAIKAQL
jgi:hypothetical protein